MIISFFRPIVRIFPILAVVGLITAGCQKVPLLAPSGSVITLNALASALPINGTTDLIAQVIEPAGTPPHSGTHVTFTTNLGRIEPAEAQTDINGTVVVKFIAGTTSGTATITAFSGGVSVASANAIKIAIGFAAVSQIVATAVPSTLPASGGTATINAFTRDASGNPVPSVPVTFATTAGILSQTVASTDANGVATVTLRTTRTATVTASAGTVAPPSTTPPSGTTPATPLTNSVTVTVNQGPAISIATSTTNPTVGQPVVFTVNITAPGTTGSPIREVIVDFGDGTRANAGTAGNPTVQHVYSSPGFYTVTATATDVNGDSNTATTSVAVSPSPLPTTTIDSTPPSPRATDTVTFTVTATAPTGTFIENLRIDFGDGTAHDFGNTVSGKVQHVYTVPAQYTVTATARDGNGRTGTSRTIIIVRP